MELPHSDELHAHAPYTLGDTKSCRVGELIKERMMSSVHMIVGLAVVIAFLISTVANYLRMTRAASFPWLRGVSFAAAGLLLLQYVLGFSLLGDDREITAVHYILALAAVIPVGAEHMFATSERPEADRNRIAFLASFAAFVLVLIVYAIGERSAA